VLTVAGGTAVVVLQEKALGLDLRDGTVTWTALVPGQAADCLTRQVAAAGQSLIALASCQSGFNVISLDPATGQPAWTARVSEPSDGYEIQILSADPVVISDALSGSRGVSRVQVFGAGGRVTSSMQVSGIPGANGPVILDTGSHDGFGVRGGVAAGLLIGIAQENGLGADIVAFRLADGQRQWRVHLPDTVTAVRLSGSQLLLVDPSDPWPSLEAISLPNGRLRAIGFFPRSAFDSGDAGLYLAGGRVIIVNLHGEKPTAPVAAIAVPASVGS
jgi:outer membrane protein assembly factor BamB